MNSANYGAPGMICMHYVNAVRPKVNAIDSVTAVTVHLRPWEVSEVRITSVTALDDQRAQAALQEAGYPLVPA